MAHFGAIGGGSWFGSFHCGFCILPLQKVERQLYSSHRWGGGFVAGRSHSPQFFATALVNTKCVVLPCCRTHEGGCVMISNNVGAVYVRSPTVSSHHVSGLLRNFYVVPTVTFTLCFTLCLYMWESARVGVLPATRLQMEG